MIQKKSPYRLMIALVSACAAAAGLLLYFALTVDYDISIQHFARQSPFAAGAVLVIACALVIGILAGILRVRDRENKGFHPTSAFGAFSASLTGFMLLAVFILSIRQLSSGIALLPLFRLVLMALSAAYFFLMSARNVQSGRAMAFLSLCPMLFGLLSVLTAYFDTVYGMNAPVKTYSILMYIAVTLFFTAEVRVVLKRVLPFWYTFFGACCLTFAGAVGLSRAAVALHDTVGHRFSLIECILCVCIALYTASRLFSFGAPANTAEAAETVPAGNGDSAAEEAEKEDPSNENEPD